MSTGTLGPTLDDLEHQSVDQVAINTIRTLSVDAVQAANSGHRARRWHLPRSRTPSGRSSSGTTRNCRSGATATGSCCRSATPRCCSTRSTGRATSCSITTSTHSAATATSWERVGADAVSLAGHLGLSNLPWIYAHNGITIEGSTNLAFAEDVPTRFAGYGRAVHEVSDADDVAAIRAALHAFRNEVGQTHRDRRRHLVGCGHPRSMARPLRTASRWEIHARVVSTPTTQLFDREARSYRDAGSPSGRDRQSRRRAGKHGRLGPLDRHGRRGHRDADLRCFCATEGAADDVRVHARAGGHCGAGAGRTNTALTRIRAPFETISRREPNA